MSTDFRMRNPLGDYSNILIQGYLKYPDKELLDKGMLISQREFEILKLVEQGLGSDQIAKKLFLSVNTVHTHRCNILKKTGKESVSDLIYSFKERGLM